MSKYTMELREIIALGIPIFKNFPVFDENYRERLEKVIIEHYYFREIGYETIERFLYSLNSHLNLIMPHYNKLYESYNLEQRILDNYDVTEIFEKTNNNIITSSNDVNTNSKNINLFSDTPVTKVDIDKNDFLSTITKDSTEQENSSNENTENIGTEKWKRTMQGNIGVQTDADAIEKYRNTLIRIDELIIEQLKIHFMGVY